MYLESASAFSDRALERASALVVGVGALGCAAASALAEAGIGHLTVVDDDRVESSNLQRQILFDERSIGGSKAEVAAARLAEVAPRSRIAGRVARIDESNVRREIDAHDIVIDGTDDPQTKYLLNRVAVRAHVPLIYGGVVRTGGLAMAIDGGRSACLACAFPETTAGAELGCDRLGILAPVAGVIGSLQGYLAIALLGGDRRVPGTLFSYELRGPRWRQLRFSRSRTCAACGAAAAPAA